MYSGDQGRFPAALRLKKDSDFVRIYRYGRVHRGTYFSFHILPYEGETRMGIVVPRRWGKAVQRNRVKRLLREVFRCNRSAFLGTEFIVRPRATCNGCRLKEIEQAFLTEFYAAMNREATKWKKRLSS